MNQRRRFLTFLWCLLVFSPTSLFACRSIPSAKLAADREFLKAKEALAGLIGSDRSGYAQIRVANLARQKTPESIAALIKLMVDPDVIEFDSTPAIDKYGKERLKGYTRWGLSWQITVILINESFKEIPSVGAWRLRFYTDDPETFRQFADTIPRELLVEDCRAWCQEVSDGLRTFQFEDSDIRYNAEGQAVNPPKAATRFSSNHRGPSEGLESSDDLNPKPFLERPISWIYLILASVILLGLITLLRQKTG